MAMILENYEASGQSALFDKAKFQIKPYPSASEHEETIKHTAGLYSSHADRLVAFFPNDTGDEMCLLVGREVILMNEISHIERTADPPIYDVTVFTLGDKKLFWKNRSPENFRMFDFDFTACVEEEDFCFSLFLENVLKNTPRRMRLLHHFTGDT